MSSDAAAWQGRSRSGADRLREAVVRRRWLVLFVVVPTLLYAAYQYLFAANQYVSEARFIVRSQGGQMPSVLGQVLGGSGGFAAEEANGVVDYVGSHDAVRALGRKVDLVQVWRRNGLDLFAAVKARPTEEELTRYYARRVRANLNRTTSIVTLTVRTFRPEDSKRIADDLLSQAEQLVNRFSERAQEDALRVSREEVDRMAARAADVAGRVNRFREERRSLDPTSSARVVTEVVGGLEGQLARARAELAAQRTYLQPGSPRLREQETRVAALQAQLESQRSRLTGGEGSLTPTVSGFERLTVERDLVTRGYASALTSLETARVDAQKQHVFLVRVVEPNLPQKSLYPRRGLNVLSLFGALLLAYGIGWVLVVGVREHAA